MKFVYCANCGKKLSIMRKAMPKLGRIIDVVEFHECSDEPVEIDFTIEDVPVFTEQVDKNKFVQKLNELKPQSIFGELDTGELMDRRSKEDIKSTAPNSLLNNLHSIGNTSPAKPLNDDLNELEKVSKEERDSWE